MFGRETFSDGKLFRGNHFQTTIDVSVATTSREVGVVGRRADGIWDVLGLKEWKELWTANIIFLILSYFTENKKIILQLING